MAINEKRRKAMISSALFFLGLLLLVSVCYKVDNYGNYIFPALIFLASAVGHYLGW